MKDYLNEINNLFPIRRREEEKDNFYHYVKAELGDDRVRLETLEKKHSNIIIGELTKAELIFTAHYDTPAASLVPNMMFPANKVIGIVINILYPLAMAFLSLFVALLISGVMGLDERWGAIFYFILYFGLFYCTTRLVSNKHNKNDNTSGVAAVMSLASEINDGRIAFVLFDNEEKGLLGSKAFSKEHKNIINDKLVINFDCVGNGDQMIFIVKEKVEKHELYEILKSVIVSSEGFEVHHLPAKKSLGNSDHKNFDCGIGVMASKRAKIVRFFTGRIHTSRDTVASSENIYFLADIMKNFISKI